MNWKITTPILVRKICGIIMLVRQTTTSEGVCVFYPASSVGWELSISK